MRISFTFLPLLISFLLPQQASAELPDGVLEDAEEYAEAQVVLLDYLNEEPEFYSTYFQDDPLFESFTSAVTNYFDDEFNDLGLQSTMYELARSVFATLPATKTEAMSSSLTHYYSMATSLWSTITSYSEDTIPTLVTQASYDTSVDSVASSGAYSQVYVYAECDALYSDIYSFGGIYNSFFESFTNTQALSSFETVYGGYTSATDANDFDSYCTDMTDFINYLPWKDRILAGAKTLYNEYTTKYIVITTSYFSTTPTTTYTDTSVTPTNSFQSSLYNQAKLFAVLVDYQDNVFEYTSFLSSYMSASPSDTAMSMFIDDLLLMNRSNTLSTSYYEEIFANIENVITDFTWSDRLNYVAKTVYESFTSVYTEPTPAQSASASPSTSSASPHTTDTKTEFTETSIQRIIFLKDNSTHSTIITQTSIITDPDEPRDITTHGESILTVTSDLEMIMVCGVNALIYDYSTNFAEYVTFITNNYNAAQVISYTEALSIYSSSNILEDVTAFANILETFYNFIGFLPSTMTTRIYDVLGYNYIGTLTDDSFDITDYETGDGYIFNQLFINTGTQASGSATVSLPLSTASDGSVSTGTASDVGNNVVYVLPTAIDIQLSATSSPAPGYTVLTLLKTDERYRLAQTIMNN